MKSQLQLVHLVDEWELWRYKHLYIVNKNDEFYCNLRKSDLQRNHLPFNNSGATLWLINTAEAWRQGQEDQARLEQYEACEAVVDIAKQLGELAKQPTLAL
jgi:hypothetical protein